MNKKIVSLLLGLVLLGLLFSPQLMAENTEDFSISGWNETVVSVRDIAVYREFFEQLAQWQLLDEGKINKVQLKAWRLNTDVGATYALFGNRGADSGFIRVVQFDGFTQIPIREDAQAWDSGGIFDINVRVKNLDKIAPKMRALGWQARSPITRFSFGKFEVKEWIVSNSDGLAFAMIERLKPTLEGWPNLKTLSRTFNSTQVVRDMETSLAFFENVLGFKRYMEHQGASKSAGPNVLGLPHNLTTEIERTVFILHPQAKNEGSVELLSFDGATGADFSKRAHLPNLGIAVLRFPVKNIETLQAHLKTHEVNFIHKLQNIDEYKSLTITAPDGAWLEFYEVIE